MTEHLWQIICGHPQVFVSLGTLAVGVVAAAAFELSEEAREILADARLALDRADCSIDRASRCAGMPQPKLSDQLRGVLPFTAMWRLFAAPDLHASEFEAEYLALRAKRRGLLLVRADVGAILMMLEELLSTGSKPMAKASLPVPSRERVSA